jgi:predicted Zn-dependent peptidase
MLFLGTEKYPDEDSFAKFLSANGGINNAFTDSEVSYLKNLELIFFDSCGLLK